MRFYNLYILCKQWRNYDVIVYTRDVPG